MEPEKACKSTLLERRCELLRQLVTALKDAQKAIVDSGAPDLQRSIDFQSDLCHDIAAADRELGRCFDSNNDDGREHVSESLLQETRDLQVSIRHLNRVQAALVRKLSRRHVTLQSIWDEYASVALLQGLAVSESTGEGRCRT
jgi:hypothetical protein